ncbi:hypothetical protein [Cupriavidus pauculus]|uniref:Uncharacterized protein n=1 Tax=Cupriavidus pauculus TaxID=82633 RepID=A0A2N5C3N4_9BURK|nr:hypothetical protein [Cupriavidus pauculus]PLP96831.1 hypothetical protein CYJ10_30020 [Cupriavidus pauculus]
MGVRFCCFIAISNLARTPDPLSFHRSLLAQQCSTVAVVAPASYPQLAEGLVPDAAYEFETSSRERFCYDDINDPWFYNYCRKLTVLISPGKPLQGRRTVGEWFKAVAALAEDEEKYPETGGRGPFWELFRYGMSGMTFGPVVCKKLVADFDAWEEAVKSIGEDKFYEYHMELRRCFAHAGDNGMVVFPFGWVTRLDDLPPYGEPVLGLDQKGEQLV